MAKYDLHKKTLAPKQVEKSEGIFALPPAELASKA